HFMVDEGFFYGLNNKSVAKEDWQKLTDVGAPIEEVEMYLSLEYNVHHELDSEGLIAGKYLMSKTEGGGTAFH
ncbi:MAG: hypothetical protein IJC43_05710, partial [Clostridia bacterium]|nr:hypothetical protein [Clostridia bacterium]